MDPAFCPLQRGCPLSEVILYGVCINKLEYFLVCPLLGGWSVFIGGFAVLISLLRIFSFFRGQNSSTPLPVRLSLKVSPRHTYMH